MASDLDVLHRVLALRLVAQLDGHSYGGRLEAVRNALLNEQWADALVGWMDASGCAVDVFDHGPDLLTSQDVEGELSAIRLQFTPIFEG